MYRNEGTYPLEKAIEASQIAIADDDENGCSIEQHPSGAYTCLDHGVSADNDRMCWFVRDIPSIVLDTSLPILEEPTPENLDRLRDTPIGRALKAEALSDVANELQHSPVDSRYLTEKALGHLVRATDIDKHTPVKEDGLPWECVFGECDHDMDEDCPPVEITLCKECYRVARQVDPYYGEEGTGEVAWPCQVVRDC